MSDETPDRLIGANVLRFRQAKGLSQSDLAEAIGVYQPTIQKIEAGTRSVKLAEAVRIARALEVDLDDVVAGPDRAGSRAAFTRIATTLRSLDEELTYLAERLGGALVDLANELGGNFAAPAGVRVPAEIAREADGWLSRRWGDDLDDFLREWVTAHTPDEFDGDDVVDALHAIVDSAADANYPGIDPPGRAEDAET